MGAGESSEEFVLVKCPTCGARLHPRRQLIGKRVRCPDCGVAVRVIETKGEERPGASRASSPGEYAISGEDPAERSAAEPQVLQVVCSLCGARLHPSVEQVGKRVRCPDCGRPVEVPAPPPPVAPRREPRPVGEYRLGAEPAPKPVPYVQPTVLAPDQPLNEPEPLPDEAPRLWWATGVFGFPWQPGTISRWGSLSIFAFFSNAVTAYTLGLVAQLAGAGGAGAFGAAMMFTFSLAAAVIIWLLMCAYAAGCVTVVVRESAAGVADITNWSEAELHEGIWRILNIVFPLAGAAGLGYGVYLGITHSLLGVSPAASFVATAAAVTIGGLTFPFMLVSTLECGAFWMLVSPEALRLVFGYFRGWVWINLLAAIITGGWWLFTLLGTRFATWPTIIVGAPLWSAVILIDARLLGRFLYKAHEIVSERAAAREDAEEESEQADDEAPAA